MWAPHVSPEEPSYVVPQLERLDEEVQTLKQESASGFFGRGSHLKCALMHSRRYVQEDGRNTGQASCPSKLHKTHRIARSRSALAHLISCTPFKSPTPTSNIA